MAVLVTGSSGFLGRNVVRALASRGATPVAFDTSPPVYGHPKDVTFVQGTITNIDEIMAAIVDNDIRSIVTLAYIQAELMDSKFGRYLDAARVNILGVTNVFEAARLAGVDRVIFSSSAGVYGPQSIYGDRPVTEDDQLAPEGLYSKMKLVNEEIAREYSSRFRLQIVIVRPVALLGAGSTMWPQRLIADPAVGKPGHLDQNPANQMNVLAVEDMASLFASLVTAQVVQHDCYLASGHSMTFGGVAGLVRSYLPDANVTLNDDLPPRQFFAHLCDNSRSVEEFSWNVHSLEDAVHMTINDARRAEGLEPV